MHMEIYLFLIIAALIVVVVALPLLAMITVVDVVARGEKSEGSKIFVTGLKEVLRMLYDVPRNKQSSEGDKDHNSGGGKNRSR